MKGYWLQAFLQTMNTASKKSGTVHMVHVRDILL